MKISFHLLWLHKMTVWQLKNGYMYLSKLSFSIIGIETKFMSPVVRIFFYTNKKKLSKLRKTCIHTSAICLSIFNKFPRKQYFASLTLRVEKFEDACEWQRILLSFMSLRSFNVKSLWKSPRELRECMGVSKTLRECFEFYMVTMSRRERQYISKSMNEF